MVSEKAVGMKKSNPLHFSNYTPLRRWWGGDLLQQMALHIKYGTEQKLYSVVQASEKITEPTELPVPTPNYKAHEQLQAGYLTNYQL